MNNSELNATVSKVWVLSTKIHFSVNPFGSIWRCVTMWHNIWYNPVNSARVWFRLRPVKNTPGTVDRRTRLWTRRMCSGWCDNQPQSACTLIPSQGIRVIHTLSFITDKWQLVFSLSSFGTTRIINSLWKLVGTRPYSTRTYLHTLLLCYQDNQISHWKCCACNTQFWTNVSVLVVVSIASCLFAPEHGGNRTTKRCLGT